jgi:LAO/AO transport system kinase
VEVVRTADVVAVVCVPGMGDSVQAIKAGIMEIADVFVVNKADREGADQVVLDIRTMLNMSSDKSEQKIPILKTVASTGEGVRELNIILFQELEARQKETERQKGRIREEILGLLEKEVARHVRARWGDNESLNTAVRQVIAHETDPYSLVQEMVAPLVATNMTNTVKYI